MALRSVLHLLVDLFVCLFVLFCFVLFCFVMFVCLQVRTMRLDFHRLGDVQVRSPPSAAGYSEYSQVLRVLRGTPSTL